MKTTENKQEIKKSRIWQKLLSGVVLLVLIGLVVFFGEQRIRERLKPTPTIPAAPLAVETLQVEPGRFMVTRRYTGSIEPTKRAQICAQVSARVTDVFYREGESVEKGGLLIALDDKELRTAVDRLVATAKGIQSDLDFWRVQDTRNEKLVKGKAIPPQKRDESKRMVSSLEAALEVNKHAHTAALTKLDYTRIVAPFSGELQRLDAEIGELAAPGKALLELVATDPLKAVFSIPQNDIAEGIVRASGKRGREVRLTAPAKNKKITSYVEHIYPVLEYGTRNATFDVNIPESTKGLKPGMSVHAIVILARYKRALVLPRAAIRLREGTAGVYMVEEGVARWRPVTIGQAQDKQVRIKSGIKKGETVIVTPDPRIKDGRLVESRNHWRSAS